MVGAVAVGMFGMPKLGVVIAGSHYLASLLLGILMRYHGGRADSKENYIPPTRENIVAKAFRELYRARVQDGRVFGQLLGDSVRNSINSLLIIGGFIALFSVVIRILTVFGIINAASKLLATLLTPLGFTPTIISALTSGFFEITIGSEVASKAVGPLLQRAMATSAVIAWSGLSVHGQVAAMITGTDIRMTPYLIARLIHAGIAAVLTLLMMPIVEMTAVLAPTSTIIHTALPNRINPLLRIGHATSTIFIILGTLLTLSLLVHILRSVKLIIVRIRQ
jgi:sporulation integral membrane protein YlbJ